MDILFYIAVLLSIGIACIGLWCIVIICVLGLLRFNAWADKVSRNIARNARRIS